MDDRVPRPREHEDGCMIFLPSGICTCEPEPAPPPERVTLRQRWARLLEEIERGLGLSR